MLWGIKNAHVNQNKATQGVFEFELHLFVCHFVNTCTFVCFESKRLLCRSGCNNLLILILTITTLKKIKINPHYVVDN